MNSENFGFEELELCNLANTFPSDEKYKLIDQIKRSARSINALIAEGHGRFTYPDQIHFCIQARGSLAETINHLTDAFDEKFITEITLTDLKKKGKEIERMLNGYLIFLRKKRDEQK